MKKDTESINKTNERTNDKERGRKRKTFSELYTAGNITGSTSSSSSSKDGWRPVITINPAKLVAFIRDVMVIIALCKMCF